MKVINEAYRWALAHPPAFDGHEAKTEAEPVMCPIHRRPAWRQCRHCRRPICPACSGFRQSLCTRHYQRAQSRRARDRVIKEWGPLVAIIVILRLAGLPGLEVSVAVLIYVAYLGFRLLLARGWFGCLALLLLPYSLVLAGVWSLIESVRDWHAPLGVGKAKP